MDKSYLYEEFIIEKDIFSTNIKYMNKSELKFIFSGIKDKKKKLILICKLDLINNKDYLLETKVIKYSEDNNETINADFYHNYKLKDDDVINLDLILNIICETNTTLLNETICGFKELYNNTLSLKLWKDSNSNYYAGLTTSYVVDDKKYDFIIVGGGPSGIYSTYKIALQNPNSKILLLENNSKTLDNYKEKGYDKTNKWNISQTDPDFQKSYSSEDNKTIWVGKGLGGGTLHFGLQYVNNIRKNYEEWINNYEIIDKDLNPQKYSYSDENNNYKPNKNWYKFKKGLENYFNSSEVNVFNNYLYSTNLDNLDRLLLGDLLNNLDNVEIKYDAKVDKLIYSDYLNNKVNSVKTFGNKYYKTEKVILCCGALETPSILQRSNINCGNKLYDHGALVGLAYGKINIPITEEPEEYKFFKLDLNNLELINKTSNRNVFNVNGNNLPVNELNNIYDFTDWSRSHPGGSYNITKWSQNNYTLIYPHSSSRWNSYKSNFVYIGKKDEIIKYDDLPENLKSEELKNQITWENKKNSKFSLVNDLGFENEKIISHLQTRNNNFEWQTYYSTVPGLNNLLILTHSQSIDLEGKGSVKINSNKNENPKIILNHFGDNKDKVIDQIYDAYIKNHNFLVSNGYILLSPNPNDNPINREYIENNLDSIYHYHGSCPIGEVVDENQKVYNIDNLYIGDISVLNKPWGGSTSYAALNTGLNVSKNFFENI